MSVELERVGWEDGTQITPARVTTATGTYDVTDATYSGETPLSAENLKKMENNVETALNAMLQMIFPVGSTYTTQNSNTNPTNILGFGTWERLQATIPLGVDDNDTSYQTIGATGGEKTHTLTIDEMPSHSHQADYSQSSGVNIGVTAMGTKMGTSTLLKSTGGGQAHNNMPPYKIVGYMWLRTA